MHKGLTARDRVQTKAAVAGKTQGVLGLKRMQVQQAPQVQQRLVELQARQGQDAGFLPESNAELATAALVQRLETVVAMASPGNRSCANTNRSPLQAASREPFTRVTVQVRMRCGNGELASVLHALEGGSPRVFVDNLNVLVQRMYFAPGTGAPRGDGGLEVTFDLYPQGESQYTLYEDDGNTRRYQQGESSTQRISVQAPAQGSGPVQVQIDAVQGCGGVSEQYGVRAPWPWINNSMARFPWSIAPCMANC